MVQLLWSRVMAGKRMVSTFLWYRTDDRGEYRFWGLPAGTYYLAVTANPWHSPRVSGEAGWAESAAYAPVYSGNTGDRSRAAPIVLRPGGEARADFTLAAVPGATVTVHHDAPAGSSGTIALVMDGVSESEGYQRQERVYGGSPVTFGGVPPGRYAVVVRTASGARNYFGRSEVMAGGAETTVEVKVLPLATVSGAIQFQNPAAPRRSSVFARLLREGGAGTQATAAGADGSFHFPDVQPGKYRAAVGSRDGHFAAEIRVEGAESRGGWIDVREGQNITLRMVASDEVGKLEGYVLDGESAVEGVLVVLAPAAESSESHNYHGFQTDSDGSFEYRNIPAGDYLLFAVEDTNFEYANPAAVRPYLDRAKRVRVEAHQSVSHRISVTKAPAAQ